MTDLRIASPAATGADRQRALRQAAAELEGVFLNELFKAMRETVPAGELAGGGMGEEVFNALMDEHLSTAMAAGLRRGLGDAVYRQLVDALDAAALRNGVDP